MERAGQLDQLEVDFADLGEVGFGNRDFDTGVLLEPLEDVQAAPAAVALQRVGRVGDPWSSWRTNCGMIIVPSMKRVSQTSAIRPSMMTEVSRIS